MPKDKVVFRSDVSSADKTPFMKAPRKVRDYFSQYGPCEVDWSTHSSRGGMEKYAVVLKFEQPPIANKIKQKYNGRALFGARVTTSWLDDRQARELGIPPSQPERPMRRPSPDSRGSTRGRRGRSLSRARGRNSPLYPLTSQEKEASTSRFGADAELHDSGSESSLSFNLEKRNRSPSPQATTKIHSMTRLERSSRLSPVSTPRAASPVKERSDALERPESRTSSHSSRERERELLQGDRSQTSSPRHSTRLRSKRRLNSDDDKSPPRSRESRSSKGKKDSSSQIYVPRSKRVKDESEEGNTSDEKKRTIFDRLGPTLEQREKQYQLEAYGDTNGTTTPPATALKSKKSSETFVSPDRGGLKSPTFESTSRHSSISSGSERETKVPPSLPPPVSPQNETESKSRRDSKHGRRERSRRESKGSSGDGSRRSSRSRREQDRDNAAQPVSQPYEQSSHHPHTEIATEHIAHQSHQQPVDHDTPITAIATADLPTTKVSITTGEEPITTKVPITATATKLPIIDMPINTTANMPIITTDIAPITTPAKMPITTPAITTPAVMPVTTAEVPMTAAGVPITTTAKVRITTTEVTITKEPTAATATESKPLPVATQHVPDHPVDPPRAFDEKDETPPPEVLEASGGMYRGYAAQWYQAMYNDPYALQQYMQSYYQQQQQQQMLQMGAEQQQAGTNRQQMLQMGAEQQQAGTNRQQMLQMGAEQQQVRTNQQQMLQMGAEQQQAGTNRQQMLQVGAEQQQVRTNQQQMLQVGAEQQQVRTNQQQMLQMGAGQQQARTNQKQMQPEWPMQRMKVEKRELQPMQQTGSGRHLGPLMQPQILPEQKVHLEQQPGQQQVWRQMWPEPQQVQLVKQVQPLQLQTWPLQPVHQIGSLQQQVRSQQHIQPLQGQTQPLQLQPVHQIGSLQQQVHSQQQRQQVQPLQGQVQPLQGQMQRLQQQTWPVRQIGSLQQQVHPPQQQVHQQQQQLQIQPLRQQTWPLQQQLQSVRQVVSVQQQVRPQQRQHTQPQFRPLEQHMWPLKQPVGPLQQQVKTEPMGPEQGSSWGSVPDDVTGYRVRESDDDSDSGEQADEEDAFSMEQMYQALQSTTNDKQTETITANSTLLDEKTSTAQMPQTSSAKEDNIPAPVEKGVISEVGVQCAVTLSLPAAPSIPTKATTGTQTGPHVKSTSDSREGEVERIWSSATGSLRRAKRKRRMGAKYKSLQKSTMEDFDQQTEPILIMTKLLVSQNPSNRAVLLGSMEASLWQVVHSLGSKFAEKTDEA